MKRVIVFLVISFSIMSFYCDADAVLGIPDKVPAATLIVPFFEVGIDSSANPEDTLLVIFNSSSSTVIVKVVIWDVFGNPILAGNFDIDVLESIPASMRSIISVASPSAKAQLTEGSFYRGFATFDLVTSSTALLPTSPGYPFSNQNALEGFIYYTRLTHGSSNGLPMIPLEATPPGTNFRLHGFYQHSDTREEIDADARYSAEIMTRGGSPSDNPNNAIFRTHSRLYQDADTNGFSRLIVFTFPEGGGSLGTNFPGSVPIRWYDEDGFIVVSTTFNLNRVVNVITFIGGSSGIASLWNIPSGFSTYAFSFNSASPGFNPALTWDAIFESYIRAD